MFPAGLLVLTLQELLPIFNRLELESGRWVPRHWPPNLGAPRDIPHGADIHPSVYNLHRAGVLKDSELPKTGGDNPHISPLRVAFAWNSTSRGERKGNEDKISAGNRKSGFQISRRLISTASRGKRETGNVSSILSEAITTGAARL